MGNMGSPQKKNVKCSKYVKKKKLKKEKKNNKKKKKKTK